MFPSSLPSSLALAFGRIFTWMTGGPPEPPSFEGLVAELFACWPLDAAEFRERAEAQGRALGAT